MFRIPKINYLDLDVFNIHRGKILTRYDDEITRLYTHSRGKLRSVTREFEDLQHRLRKYRILNYHSHVSALSCTIFKYVVVSFVSHGMGTGHIARCLKK